MANLQPRNCDRPPCRAAALPGKQYCADCEKLQTPAGAVASLERMRYKNEPWRRWYHTAHWRNLRKLVLHRDPVCMICERDPSTIADHIKAHKGSWALFCSLWNLQGLCKRCHDIKTATEDGGGGNTMDKDAPVPTGEPGKQFSSSSVGEDALDKALMEED